jgi:hypothetical protein
LPNGKLHREKSLQNIIEVVNAIRIILGESRNMHNEIRIVHKILVVKTKGRSLTLFILVHHTSKLNEGMVVNIVRCDLIC